jgi:hypothetical protein
VDHGFDRKSKFGRLGYLVEASESGNPEESSALSMWMPEGKVIAFQQHYLEELLDSDGYAVLHMW